MSRDACNPSLGVNLTGIRENYLQLSIGEGVSVSVSLISPAQDDQTVFAADEDAMEISYAPSASSDGAKMGEGFDKAKKLEIPSQLGLEIYLRQLFHEYVFVKAKNKANASSKNQIPALPRKDSSDILGHFCISLAHRIFSNKVLSMLENLVWA